MKRPIMLVVATVTGVMVLGGYWYWQQPAGAVTDRGAGKSAKGKGLGGPVSVTTVVATRQPMPVVIDAVGTVESEHSVAVRPQTSGVLDAVLFKEGDPVKQGQVLFRIDPRPLKAAVEQSRAALARDQAQLAQAQAQEARLKPLVEKDYITRNEYEVALTQSKSLQATVEANRAALEQAQLQLSYTTITAPISGRTGSLSVRAGNLVTGGTGGAPLVVINSTRPILVSLSVPQRFLDEVRQAWSSGDIKVTISPNPISPSVAEGSLVFIDNAVNQQTGTIALKARVRNEKEQLWPGQFVAARIVLRVEENALVLPESAVQPGQDTSFVYVAKDGRARLQNVEVDRQIDDLVVISKGLNGGEAIIREVPPVLADGAAIVVRDGAGEKGDGKGKGGKGRKAATNGPDKESPSRQAPGKDASRQEARS